MYLALFKYIKSRWVHTSLWVSFAPPWHNMVLTHQCYCSGINIKLGEKKINKKINCPEARSVNFHTLSPISLKVEVLNQIKPSQCTVELCAKWHGDVERQLLKETAFRLGNTGACLFPPHVFILLGAVATSTLIDSVSAQAKREEYGARRWCKQTKRKRRNSALTRKLTGPVSAENTLL